MTLTECASLFVTDSKRRGTARMLKDRGLRRLMFAGLTGSAPAVFLSTLDVPLGVVVCNDLTGAGYMFSDLTAILGPDAVAIFPSGYKRDIKYGQPDGPQQILRTETLDRLHAPKSSLTWIVTYPEALAERVAAPEAMARDTLRFHPGDTVRISELLQRLLDMGFHKVDYVYEPGQFAVRGSIFDIFSYSRDMPYRFDFFDEDIDTIRTFNIETQLSEGKEDEAVILSARASDATGGVSLLDTLDDDTLLFCADPDFITARVASVASQTYSDSAVIAGEGDPDSMQKVVDPDEFRARFETMRVAQFTPNREAGENIAGLARMVFDTAPQTLYHKNFDLIADSFADFLAKGTLNPISMATDTQCLTYQIPGGMLSNLLSQLKSLNALDKFDEALLETPRVRADMGYPPLVTPTSQLIGTQAVQNVLAGERYKNVGAELKAYCRGEYGKTPAPINKEVQAKILGDEKPLTGRYADTLPKDIFEKAQAELGDTARCEEDVLSYISFPPVAEKFFAARKEQEEKKVKYSIVSVD